MPETISPSETVSSADVIATLESLAAALLDLSAALRAVETIAPSAAVKPPVVPFSAASPAAPPSSPSSEKGLRT